MNHRIANAIISAIHRVLWQSYGFGNPTHLNMVKKEQSILKSFFVFLTRSVSSHFPLDGLQEQTYYKTVLRGVSFGKPRGHVAKDLHKTQSPYMGLLLWTQGKGSEARTERAIIIPAIWEVFILFQWFTSWSIQNGSSASVNDSNKWFLLPLVGRL